VSVSLRCFFAKKSAGEFAKKCAGDLQENVRVTCKKPCCFFVKKSCGSFCKRACDFLCGKSALRFSRGTVHLAQTPVQERAGCERLRSSLLHLAVNGVDLDIILR
jgi:hypothetical protein